MAIIQSFTRGTGKGEPWQVFLKCSRKVISTSVGLEEES